ncbi:ThiF family adenylyltransferase [Cellulomonas sp. PhB143]|uniref:ThiF family adenylyltransferase n=1 Tax=Cellulomonas sp. PhB143 TaxID=2485186 RepID=UPI000F470409|nr:ThiF family adenylyltransferase [Cellulomonas sp. PhB143]ROS78993.1 adenylyltransferase/sulfurtransferase [Cellulomonas sp. PhB143]
MADQRVRRLAPLVEPGPELTGDRLARYARHVVLPGIGTEGQRRLAAARVLVVGAGGLGSPALLYLAAAGVGTLGVVDDDVVDVSNLQRQVLHGVADVGRTKVDSARDAVAALDPATRVVAHRVRLDAGNVLEILRGYDVVLDGADNFATRYLVSDAAEVLGLPVVWGSIYRFGGQVSVFWGAPRFAPDDVGPDAAARTGRGPTYRDVFPQPPPPGTVPDCATGGVFGTMCASIGAAMATETVKLVTGVGRSLHGRLAVHDALEGTWRELAVRPDPTRAPVAALLEGPGAYAAFCGLPGAGDGGTDRAAAAASPSTASVRELAAAVEGGLGDWEVPGDARPVLLDVREEWEAQIVAVPGARLVPSGTFLGTSAGAHAALADLPTDRPVLVLCKAGARSARVADAAREAGVDARTVDGGILAWVDEVAPHERTY